MSGAQRFLFGYVALAAIALVVYWPSLAGGFLWDDADWIRDNEALRSWAGLWRIWFEPGAVIQYYPLTYTSWWLDWQLWGLSPTVMHVENVLLHAANALLFGWLLWRLQLPGAFVAALVLLVHPVHSESVAWLVERKNTLSALFYLGSCHLWCSQLQQATTRRSRLLATCFLAALLAKTATLMLPVTLLAIALWRDGGEWRRSLRSRVRQLVPLSAMSLVFAFVTIVRERGEGAVGHDWDLTMSERVVLLGQNVWFYAGKLLWPVPGQLSFVYAKWDLQTASVLAWLPTGFVVAGLLFACCVRRRVGMAIGLALLVYVANLLPVSGLVDFYYLRYAFAADHFQYLPSIGPIALLVCGAAWWLRGRMVVGLAAGAIICALLAWHTWHRVHIYRDLEVLWRSTIETEPGAWLAHSNLGNLLDERDGAGAGSEHHRRAVAIYGDAFESLNALGNELARNGQFEAAEARFERALVVRPHDALTYNNLGALYGMQRDYRKAVRWFAKGYDQQPDNRDVMRNLAVALSQSPDAAVRDPARALVLARRLNNVAEPSVFDRYVLFRAVLLGGDRREAVRIGEQVTVLARRQGDEALARRIDRQLRQVNRR